EWERFITTLEPTLKLRAENDATLTRREEEMALRLAVAYSKLHRKEDLMWLNKAYGGRIKDEKISEAFNFLTYEMQPVDYRQLEESLEMDKVQSFLDDYALPPEPQVAPAPAEPPAEP